MPLKPNSKPYLSVIMPVYKQEQTIYRNVLEILASLNSTPYEFELIPVVDGTNLDKSLDIIETIEDPKVKAVGYQENRGKGYAVRYGMKHAEGKIITFIDAGMDIDPEGIKMLLEHMKWYDADIIIGSKLHSASLVEYPKIRKVLTYGYYLLVKLLFGLKVRDTQTGLKAYKKEVLKKVLPRLVVKQFAFDIEILAVANYLGFNKIYDAPVKVDLDWSASTIKLLGNNGVFFMLVDTLAIWYRLFILKFYDKKYKQHRKYDEVLNMYIYDSENEFKIPGLSSLRPNQEVVILERKKKKIALFCWRDNCNPKSGGAEYVTYKHAQAWVDEGYEVEWFAAHFAGAKSDEEINGIRYLRFGPEKVFFILAGFYYLFKTNHDYDVIIDQVHGFPNFSTLWAPQTKKILFIHEVAGEIWHYMFPTPIAQIGRLLEILTLNLFYKNQYAWVDAHCTKQDLVNIGFDSEKITVIPCAIEPPSPLTTKKANQLQLVFLSRIVKMKGVEFALETFQKIQAIMPQATLKIVGRGDPEYVSQLREKVKIHKLDTVVDFLGHVSQEEKYQLLANSHFLLHTSVKEGFGLTVLEANSQKTPAAIFDVGSLNELVEDQETGLVAPFMDTSLLAKKIIESYSEPEQYKEMAQKAFSYQLAFRWNYFTKLSIKLLESL